MFKSLNDCLFVLKNVEYFKIVQFVPTKLLNLKIHFLKACGVCSIQNKFVYQKNIVEKLCMIVYSSQNIVEYQLYIVEYITNCLNVTYIVETK